MWGGMLAQLQDNGNRPAVPFIATGSLAEVKYQGHVHLAQPFERHLLAYMKR